MCITGRRAMKLKLVFDNSVLLSSEGSRRVLLLVPPEAKNVHDLKQLIGGYSVTFFSITRPLIQSVCPQGKHTLLRCIGTRLRLPLAGWC